MSEERLSPVADVQGPPKYDDWRELLEEGVLLGTECESCGWITATPKRRCGECGNEQLEGIALPTTGDVYSETTINVTPAGFDDSYQIAIVDLNGTLITAQIDGSVEIGDRVRFGDIVTPDGRPAPVFEPVE
jgi:uncharacterized OB-fold protein